MPTALLAAMTRAIARQVLVNAVAAAALAIVAGAAVAAQPSAPDPTARFVAATREYAQLHRKVENRLGPMEIAVLPADILAKAKAMADAISSERINAREGDLFTPQLAPLLRSRIAAALAKHRLTPADLATDEVPEGVSRQALVLRVGGPHPWVVGSEMLPSVLEVLPELPPELQYRFMFRDLVLVDVHANMVVDILRDALADK